MKTVIVNVDNDRSSAVDRVAFIPDQNVVVVRFKKSGQWYEKNVEPKLMLMATERFNSQHGSFGKWAHFYGLFDGMIPTHLNRVLA